MYNVQSPFCDAKILNSRGVFCREEKLDIRKKQEIYKARIDLFSISLFLLLRLERVFSSSRAQSTHAMTRGRTIWIFDGGGGGGGVCRFLGC